MQAIVTKYIGPTNTKGARIKATASSGSVTVGYHSFDDNECKHRYAAASLCHKLNWGFDHVPGELPDGSMVWVRIPHNLKLSDRIRSIALGETYSQSDLTAALAYCRVHSDEAVIKAHIRGCATHAESLRLQEIADLINC
jgi:hypothetical protein